MGSKTESWLSERRNRYVSFLIDRAQAMGLSDDQLLDRIERLLLADVRGAAAGEPAEPSEEAKAQAWQAFTRTWEYEISPHVRPALMTAIAAAYRVDFPRDGLPPAKDVDYAALGLAVLSWYASVRDAKDTTWLKIERGSALAKSMDDMLRGRPPVAGQPGSPE